MGTRLILAAILAGHLDYVPVCWGMSVIPNDRSDVETNGPMLRDEQHRRSPENDTSCPVKSRLWLAMSDQRIQLLGRSLYSWRFCFFSALQWGRDRQKPLSTTDLSSDYYRYHSFELKRWLLYAYYVAYTEYGG